MNAPQLALKIIPEPLAILKLAPDAPIPSWALRGNFSSITRTPEELSIVCTQLSVPEDSAAAVASGWRALQVEGVLDFSLTGVLASLTAPLAENGISIFAVSTYNTDYILVQETLLSRAVSVLTAAGYFIAET